MTPRPRGRGATSVARVALVVGGVVAALVLLEGFLRVFPGVLPAATRQRVGASPAGFGAAHPVIGHLNSPNSRLVVEGRDFRATHVTDALGFRNAWPWPAGADVVAVGDSLTFGYGVEDAEAWPAVLARALPQARVINLGLIGSSPPQYLRVYETFGLPLRPAVLLVGIFTRNDFWDAGLFERWRRSGVGGNYMVWRDFGRPAAGPAAAGRPPSLKDTLIWQTRKSRLANLARQAWSAAKRRRSGEVRVFTFADGRRLQLLPRDLADKTRDAQAGAPAYAVVLESLERLHRLARDRGTRVLMIFLPNKEEVYLPLLGAAVADSAAALRQAFDGRDVGYLDLTPLFRERAAAGRRLFFESDGHPNAEGHALIADAVRRRLERDGALSRLGRPPAARRELAPDERHSRPARVAPAPAGSAGGPGTPRRINLVYPRRPRTQSPPGWIAYDGTRYSAARGLGWIEQVPRDSGGDRGLDAPIVLPDGRHTTPRLLGRPELASWQGTHPENRPLVFRVDLPDGWYRIRCASVDPGPPLPLVDRRSFKCRAHDAVFTGAATGPALTATGPELVEGAGVVEARNGQVRIVVGDPSYPGWTWRHDGHWARGWAEWFGAGGTHRYATGIVQKLTRVVDPGFHSLRLNSLEIEPALPPGSSAGTLFRDFFDRDDSSDVNAGLAAAARWRRDDSSPSRPIAARLYKTALTLTRAGTGAATVAFVQERLSPPAGRIRYATRVSLFSGEGSRDARGAQEAGLVILGPPGPPVERGFTFVGVGLGPAGSSSGVIVRVGDGGRGHRAEARIPDARLPARLTAGEHEIVVVHDVGRGRLDRVQVDGADVTALLPEACRIPPRRLGRFGLRAAMDPGGAGVTLQQFYWSYRVERLAGSARGHDPR